MPANPETWTDAERAQWILEHQWNELDVVYIYECVGNTVYRRPALHPDILLPPWMSKERQQWAQFRESEDPDFSGPSFLVTDSEHDAKQHYTTIFGEIADK